VSTTVKMGLLIGLLCAAWMLVMGIAGWHKDPLLQNAFWAVVLIQTAVLVWGLKKTASTNTLGGQLTAGVVASLIGGAVLFIFSWLYTTTLFPDYFEELRVAGREAMRGQGMSEEEIATALAAVEPMQTSFMQALFGFLGTAVTGLIASLPIAAAFRKKK